MSRLFLNISIYLTLATFIIVSHGIQIPILPGQLKCIKEEFRPDTLIRGNIRISPPDPLISLKATVKEEIAANYMWSKEDISSTTFAFTAQTEGPMVFCFEDIPRPGFANNGGASRRMVTFELEIGEQRDYNELARKENLDRVGLELRKIEDLANVIKNDFGYMRKREEKHRDTSESTNSRVSWMSSISLFVLACLCFWQIYYLKRYFKSKKLI